jgi:large conductance mechanosensitive channel
MWAAGGIEEVQLNWESSMSVSSDFKKFLLQGNVVDLAVGVVIGGAFGKIVAAFVDDLVMPMVSPLIPGGNWREATVTSMNIKIGHLLGTSLDFLIVAAVIYFVVVKGVGALSRKKEEAAPAPPATKTCGDCLETVPAAAKRCKFCTSALAVVLLMLLGAPAFAQEAPKFEYVKPVIVAKPDVEWTAQVKGGLMSVGGNSQATNVNLGGTASRKAGDNKFSLDLAGAYGETKNRAYGMTLGSDANITREKVESTNNALGRARYDRFLTENNAAYVVGAVGRDKIAGKDLFGGGQVGYSRLLLKDEQHLLVGEFGYDFSYESYLAVGAEAVSVHSARVFLGEAWKISETTGVYGNLEALFNLNEESKAANVNKTNPIGGDKAGFAADGVGAFKDTRINGKAGLTTQLWKNLNFGFGFTFRYDQNPAVLKTPIAATYTPFAEKIDVITEASLIVTLL